MFSEEFDQFAVSMLVLTVLSFMTLATVAPPDPFTQLFSFAALVPVLVIGSYVLSYRVGYKWM